MLVIARVLVVTERPSDAEVLAVAPRVPAWTGSPAGRVRELVDERRRAGVAIGLTAEQWAVLRSAAAGEPVPPLEEWELKVIRARRSSSCPFCPELVDQDAEIARWVLTWQWGHRTCVEQLAEQQPPTQERLRKYVAVGSALNRRQRDISAG